MAFKLLLVALLGALLLVESARLYYERDARNIVQPVYVKGGNVFTH